MVKKNEKFQLLMDYLIVQKFTYLFLAGFGITRLQKLIKTQVLQILIV